MAGPPNARVCRQACRRPSTKPCSVAWGSGRGQVERGAWSVGSGLYSPEMIWMTALPVVSVSMRGVDVQGFRGLGLAGSRVYGV